MALNEESRLLSMRILQNFVREKKGKWNQDDWKKLMQRVRKAGFEKVDEGRIGKLLEDNRERWLSGDNSVGPPPPGSKPAAKKAEPSKPAAKKPEPPKPVANAPRQEEKAAQRNVGKEKPAMPEQQKKEAPKPQTAGVGAGAGPSSRAQVSAISSKEAKVSDLEAQEKHQRRVAVIKSSQDLTQESMDTEVEIRKQEHTLVELQRRLGGLEGQRAPLEKQLKSIQDDVDGSTKKISELQKGIEQLTVQRANLEGSVGSRKKERSEHVANIIRLKSEKEGLIT